MEKCDYPPPTHTHTQVMRLYEPEWNSVQYMVHFVCFLAAGHSRADVFTLLFPTAV